MRETNYPMDIWAQKRNCELKTNNMSLPVTKEVSYPA